MKKHINLTTLLAMLMLLAQTGLAQISIPRPSPTATVVQAVGLTEFEINYSRPGAKGRTIMGDLVPYGKVWRTGANANTVIIKPGEMDVLPGSVEKDVLSAISFLPGITSPGVARSRFRPSAHCRMKSDRFASWGLQGTTCRMLMSLSRLA